MENVLQKSVSEQSKLHDEKYKLQTLIEDCVLKLTESGEQALKYLYDVST